MSNGSPPAKTLSSTSSQFHFLAGLFSGLTSSILLQPADLLKTRVQQSRHHSLLPTLKAIISSPHPFRGLWRGTLPSALRTGLGSALYFSSLNALRQRVAANSTAATVSHGSSALPKLSNSANLMTGAIARTAAGLIMMPVTVIKVRYESEFYAYKSLWGAGKEILSREGIRGFFAGFGATAVRDAPYAGLYVVFYEGSKKRLSAMVGIDQAGLKQGEKKGSGKAASVNFTSGVFAAGVATAITNPFDAVKTRLQLMPAKYGNMAKAVKLMLREEGFRSLMDGLGLRMGRKAMSSALAWTLYEELISRAERQWKRKEEEQALGGSI